MKTASLLFAGLIANALLLLSVPFLERGQGAGPEWMDDLEAGFERASETGQPLLIVFR